MPRLLWLNRPVLALDPERSDQDNDEVYRRAAKRLQDFRREHGVDQVTFAQRAKISVGCLQAFERGIRATRKKNVVKIAKVMGISVDELTADDDPVPAKPDPLLAQLRHEDKVIANKFHHAGAEPKMAIKELLSDDLGDEQRESCAQILRMLIGLPHDNLRHMRRVLAASIEELEESQRKRRASGTDTPPKASGGV